MTKFRTVILTNVRTGVNDMEIIFGEVVVILFIVLAASAPTEMTPWEIEELIKGIDQ